MTEKTGSRLTTAILVAAILVVAGWLGWSLGPGAEDERVDLDGAVGGPFTLVDSRGETVRSEDFHGRFMLVFFGYTYCPDICPMTLMHITKAMETLENTAPSVAGQVTPVFISVDPERDTPEQIARYLENFHPSVVGLTGSMDKVRRTAASYAVVFETVDEDREEGYLVDHTSNILLMGPDGSYITHFSPRTPADLIANILKRTIGG